ncbi:hypothetical protein [Streptacidiphilus anmyonensis]|uniref:hypothetical protein n=1 Tax=Streptacidiphilus anmyonensis TaxID=405782 RepID=UPI00128D86F9|nr:hypothetical protein [Streptacidiphilus anmyonensis]
MEARHGPALSEREREALTGIEEALREDRALEERLRTMRPAGSRWLRRWRRTRGPRRSGGGAGA